MIHRSPRLKGERVEHHGRELVLYDLDVIPQHRFGTWALVCEHDDGGLIVLESLGRGTGQAIEHTAAVRHAVWRESVQGKLVVGVSK